MQVLAQRASSDTGSQLASLQQKRGFLCEAMLLGTFKHVKLKRARFSNWWDPLGSPAWGFPWLRRAT